MFGGGPCGCCIDELFIFSSSRSLAIVCNVFVPSFSGVLGRDLVVLTLVELTFARWLKRCPLLALLNSLGSAGSSCAMGCITMFRSLSSRNSLGGCRAAATACSCCSTGCCTGGGCGGECIIIAWPGGG